LIKVLKPAVLNPQKVYGVQ